MHIRYFPLTAAGALAFAGVAQAQPASSIQSFMDRMESEAVARLADAGVNVAGSAKLRFSVDSVGRVSGVRMLRSSGSSETDARIRAALEQVQVDRIPADLLGANITLAVTNDALANARTP